MDSTAGLSPLPVPRVYCALTQAVLCTKHRLTTKHPVYLQPSPAAGLSNTHGRNTVSQPSVPCSAQLHVTFCTLTDYKGEELWKQRGQSAYFLYRFGVLQPHYVLT